MGLLWNLTSESETLKILDEYLGELEHSSRCSEEHPVVIISDKQLEMVSFPMVKHIRASTGVINRAIHAQTNMIGQVVASRNEVEMTAGFVALKVFWYGLTLVSVPCC